MTNGKLWSGSFYRRKSDNTLRQRGTGFVVGNVKVINRKNQRNRVIVTNGKNFKGVEIPRHNVYGSDPKRTKASLKKFQVRVKSNRPTAKKPRSSHNRILG